MKAIISIIKKIGLIVLIFFLLNLFCILFFRFIDPSSTSFIYHNSEKLTASLFSTDDFQYKPTALNNVSLYLPLAIIASEDQKFFEHFGFDFVQIEKAMKENEYRKRKRGASTISMQVAKNLFLWSERNIVRKGLEAYFTLMIELLWSKARIIETYMSIAEFGVGIYGVKTASNIFYKKDPEKISILEAATLAAILPNPKKRNPAKPSRYVIARRGEIIRQMNLMGGISYIKQNLD